MRLIDLDSEYIQETLYRRGFKTRQDIEEWLNNAPTIDAVPVVRCRECKHRGTDDCIFHIKGEPADEELLLKLDNDFCSYGERKEGADDVRKHHC